MKKVFALLLMLQFSSIMADDIETPLEIKAGIYLHYQGEYYDVIGVGSHVKTLEDLVFYRSIDTDSLWAMPKADFLEKVFIDGKEGDKFKYIG